MKNLVVYNNAYVYLLMLSVLKEEKIEEYDIVLNPFYHNTSIQLLNSNLFLKLHTDKNVYFLEEINFKEYENVFITYPIIEKDNFFTNKIINKNVFFVEEGISSYLEDKNFHKFKKSTFFVTKPELIPNSKKIDTKNIFTLGNKLFSKEIKMLPKNIDKIIFTEPMEFEGDKAYTEKVSNYINSFENNFNLLIKRHPRDDSNYNIKNNNSIFFSPKEIPGQLLFTIYPNAQFIFTNFSTLEILCPEYIKKVVLKDTYQKIS